MTEQLANFGSTTIAEDLDDSETTVTVTSGAVFPASGNFRVNCEDELMLVTARSTNDLTVTRGIEGTSPAAHTNGALIKQVLTAASLVRAIDERSGTLIIDLSVSGAHTTDRADGATHDLTLTGNATITPDHTSPIAGEAIDLRLLIRQDGTGGHTLAWGGTITWAGGSAPTMPTDPDALLTVGLLSVDDAATWLGYVADTDVIADILDLPTAETDTDLRLAPDGAGGVEWATTPTVDGPTLEALGVVGPVLISDTPSTPLVFADLIQNEAQDDLVYADL